MFGSLGRRLPRFAYADRSCFPCRPVPFDSSLLPNRGTSCRTRSMAAMSTFSQLGWSSLEFHLQRPWNFALSAKCRRFLGGDGLWAARPGSGSWVFVWACFEGEHTVCVCVCFCLKYKTPILSWKSTERWQWSPSSRAKRLAAGRSSKRHGANVPKSIQNHIFVQTFFVQLCSKKHCENHH